jgi:hypothetical protein
MGRAKPKTLTTIDTTRRDVEVVPNCCGTDETQWQFKLDCPR